MARFDTLICRTRILILPVFFNKILTRAELLRQHEDRAIQYYFRAGGQALTDDQLYREYLAGDQAAGDELMLRSGDALTAYLNAFVHDPDDAEDLMLDCFTVILVDKPKIADGHFRAYLFKIARNKANRLWKLRFRQQEFVPDETLPSTDPMPEEEVWINDRSAVLHKCLNRIAPQYREALWLVYPMGMSYTQAADVLGTSPKKIDNLLAKGKKLLREELEKAGFEW